MYGANYRVSIECLENGFAVEVPDMEARAEKLAAETKAHKGSGAPSPYYGDCTKKYAAKSVGEVVKLVKGALEKIPENEFDAAFEAAGSKGG